MLSRHNEEAKGVSLPTDWLDEVTTVINSTYESLLKQKKLTLKTYGELHKGEVCLAFCLYSMNKEDTSAISLFLSVDLKEKEDPKVVLDNTINRSSEFFDLFLSGQEDELYQPNWVESDLAKGNFYFKITRENISLTIEANRLLEKL